MRITSWPLSKKRRVTRGNFVAGGLEVPDKSNKSAFGGPKGLLRGGFYLFGSTNEQ